MYALPSAIEIYKKYSRDDVTVLGLATAFEDYDKNTLDNLRLLLNSGEVIGDTLNALRQYGQLIENNKLPYKIPFPVGMDILKKIERNFSDNYVIDFMETNIENYTSYPDSDKKILFERVKHYLRNKEYSAMTFETYRLQGTPSVIVVDRKGILREVSFGASNFLHDLIDQLVNE
jgi:hypothetical protein